MPPGVADAAVLLASDTAVACRAGVVVATDDGGYVYEGGLRDLPIPPEANVTRTLTAVVLASSTRPTEAETFVGWLLSPDGQAAILDGGLLPAPAGSLDPQLG